MKICSKCKVEKPLTEFYTRPSGEIRNPCKKCECAYASKWSAEHPERVRLTSRRQRTKDPKKAAQFVKNWKAKKGEKQKLFRIAESCRTRVRNALRGLCKSDSTLTLIGCSILQLKEHLQEQFKPGMTWENRGRKGWHIDHIKPCSKFDLTDAEQQKICFHYTNLQPLWAKENYSKSDKYAGD